MCLRSRPRLRAALAAGGTFLAGFGAMNLWWNLWPRDPGLRGFYDYRAATLGDGVLMPLVAWTLVRTHDRLDADPSDRVAGWAGGAVGALVGAAVVVAALADPSGEANWTSPRPGVFTAPGWYHNGFVIAASAVAAALYARVLVRAWRQPAVRGVRGGLVVLGVLGLGFAVLVSLDNAASFNPLSHGVSAAALGVGLAAVAVPVAQLARRRGDGRRA